MDSATMHMLKLKTISASLLTLLVVGTVPVPAFAGYLYRIYTPGMTVPTPPAEVDCNVAVSQESGAPWSQNSSFIVSGCNFTPTTEIWINNQAHGLRYTALFGDHPDPNRPENTFAQTLVLWASDPWFENVSMTEFINPNRIRVYMHGGMYNQEEPMLINVAPSQSGNGWVMYDEYPLNLGVPTTINFVSPTPTKVCLNNGTGNLTIPLHTNVPNITSNSPEVSVNIWPAGNGSISLTQSGTPGVYSLTMPNPMSDQATADSLAWFNGWIAGLGWSDYPDMRPKLEITLSSSTALGEVPPILMYVSCSDPAYLAP